MVKKDLTGRRFGRLVAVSDTGDSNEKRYRLWLCRCDCGKEIIVSVVGLTHGDKRSCGCLRKQRNIEKTIKMNIHALENDLVENTKLSNLNKTIPKNNTSGVKGVSWDESNKVWIAHLKFKRDVVLSKRFKNKQDAINARKEAEEKYFNPILEKYVKEQKP